jgi:hypothetical protein
MFQFPHSIEDWGSRTCLDLSSQLPSEFGADFVEGAEHRSFFRFNSSTLEFIRCSLHHGFRSHIATDHMSLVFRREWYTSK